MLVPLPPLPPPPGVPVGGPSICSKMHEERAGPGNRWNSGILLQTQPPPRTPVPGPIVIKAGSGAQDQEKGEERQTSQPQGLGCFVSAGGWGGVPGVPPLLGGQGPVFPWKP